MLMRLILEEYQEKLQNSRLHPVLCGAIWHMRMERQLVGVMPTIRQIFRSILAADLIFIQISHLEQSNKRCKSQPVFAIESFPVIREERYEWDCTGPVRLYEKAGFVIAEKRDDFVVMRKELFL